MTDMVKRAYSILTKAEKAKLLFLAGGSLVLSFSEVFSIGIIIPIIALFMAPEKVQSSNGLGWLYRISGVKDPAHFLLLLSVAAFLLFLFKFILASAMLYKQQRVMGMIYNRLTTKALESYLDKPYIFHLMNNSSALFKNVLLEASNFVYYFLNPIITISSEALILASVSALLLCIYFKTTITLIISFSVLAFVINSVFRKRVKAYSVQREIYSEAMYKTGLEALGAVKEIHVYGARDFFAGKYMKATEMYTDGFMKFTVLSGMPRYIFELVLFTFIMVVILASSFLHKTPAEMVPMLSVVGVASLRLLPSITKIYNSIHLFHYSLNSVDALCGIIESDDNKYGKAPKPVTGDSAGDIRPGILFKDVSFGYPGSENRIFHALNVSIPLNRIVAIVGETGTGKSTLIDMLTGLLTPQVGTVSYRSTVIDTGTVAEYRKKVGYVPQNIFLIDDTIRANIAFGTSSGEIDEERVQSAVRKAQLDTFIGELPKGLDTQVGERGVRISGGQRQRIGIARALYRSPEILILDESTSALDGNTEAGLYGALKGMASSMTIIIVTHRLSALEKSDLIYVIDGGKIVDQGSYKDISARSGLFQKMALKKEAGDTIGT